MQFLKKNRVYILIGSILIVLLLLIVYYSHSSEDSENVGLYTYFKEFFELLSFISVTAGSLGILYAYKSYTDLQKGINFTVINGCMTRYTSILPNLIKIETESHLTKVQYETTVRSYYDLSNEQLYYIGVGLIPAPIEKTWIEGISRQIPKLIKQNPGVEAYIRDYDFVNSLYEYINPEYKRKPKENTPEESGPKPVISELKKQFKDQIKIDELAHYLENSSLENLLLRKLQHLKGARLKGCFKVKA